MNAIKITSTGTLRGQLVEVGDVMDEHGEHPYGEGFGAAKVVMPVEDLRRFAEMMFEWGEFSFSIARIVDTPAPPEDPREVPIDPPEDTP